MLKGSTRRGGEEKEQEREEEEGKEEGKEEEGEGGGNIEEQESQCEQSGFQKRRRQRFKVLNVALQLHPHTLTNLFRKYPDCQNGF